MLSRGPMLRPVVLMTLISVACGGGDSGAPFEKNHPRIYLTPNRERLAGSLTSTTAGMRFKSMVDRWVSGQEVYAFPAWNAALVGQLTGDPKYCVAAVAAVDTGVVTAEQAIAEGNAPEVARDNYLAIGDTVGDLALVYDWCYGAIESDRRDAWLAYANQAVSNVWHPDQAQWGGKPMTWSGWAIDNPSDNYYYSFLRATMLLGLAAHDEVDGAADWLTQFHDTKLVNELVPMFDADLVGGGSREGTGYGISMRRLFELYDLWHASTGEDLATKTPHTRASTLAFIHATLPTLDRVAPTGDQARDSTAAFFDYHRNYLQELVALFPSDPLASRAQALLAKSSVPMMEEPFMYAYDFLYDNSDVPATSLEGLGTAYYAPGIGQIYARSSWDPHATWINLIAGAYTESHAHQDQGALMIYKDGWLAYDPVVDSTSGLRQEVEAHNTLRIVEGTSTLAQKVGKTSQLLALHRGNGWLYAAADLTPTYAGHVGKLQREIVYLEPDCVVVYDRVTTGASQQQVWQLAMPGEPRIVGSETQMTASGHTLTIQRASPLSATGSVYSYATDSDFTGGFRLDETHAGGDQRWLHILWIDRAVTSQIVHDPNTVYVTLANGTVANVSFNPNGVGGSLKLGATTIPLGAGIDTLPE